ncbi:hypothetical protein FGIG_07445 [Fasciola gigantica]|uniref:Uncharacterized protein n=1 Tax=Fasciola gigantica TaxID=46835 RepID=A0A504YB79_FASGI|nr:hypothetical protein FGIG_07445 [Fasciola gigantica]
MVQWCEVAEKNIFHSNPQSVMFEEVGRRFQIIKFHRKE